MTRIVAGAAPPLEEIEFFLWLGPPNSGPPEFSDEQAAAAWRAYGRTIMADWPRDKPGFRPEAFWQYEIGERPDTHEAAVLLLAERGVALR